MTRFVLQSDTFRFRDYTFRSARHFAAIPKPDNHLQKTSILGRIYNV